MTYEEPETLRAETRRLLKTGTRVVIVGLPRNHEQASRLELDSGVGDSVLESWRARAAAH
jgi:hypothetical protein